MHGQSEIGEDRRLFAVVRMGGETFMGAFETAAEGQMRVRITQRSQQSADSIGTFPNRANETLCRLGCDLGSDHLLEQRTLEIAAERGAVSINAATTIRSKRGAGLRETVTGDSGRHGCRAPPSATLERQTQSGQLQGFVGLQPHIDEQHPVAAMATGETQLPRFSFTRYIFRIWLFHPLMPVTGRCGNLARTEADGTDIFPFSVLPFAFNLPLR
jgi:hypothetical protein